MPFRIGSMRMGTRRRWLAAVAVAVVLAACNGDDSDGEPSTITDPPRTSSSTSSSTSTTSTTVDPDAEAKAEVEAAYLAYWDVWLEIYGAPNPNNPLIDQYLSGPAKEQALSAISDLVLEGNSVQPPVDPADFSARVLSVDVDGERATVRACVLDGSRVVRNADGVVLNDTVATYLVDTTMVLDGTWKRSETRQIERREERWSCDA